MSDICIVGCGFVGLTVAAALSKKKHRVVCVDRNASRVALLRSGRVPFYEPSLTKHLADAHELIRYEGVIPQWMDAYVVCVGTPLGVDGRLDCSAVRDAVRDVATAARKPLIVVKSTLQPGTCRSMLAMLRRGVNADATLLFWPETLREGSALADFEAQPCVVGESEEEADDRVDVWFSQVLGIHIDRLVSYESAELFKLALNGYLAMRVSYINEIAGACLETGADIRDVQALMSTDQRVGGGLCAGPGWSGSCWPKDVPALCSAAKFQRHDCVAWNIEPSNRARVRRILNVICSTANQSKICRVAIWGCAFKENTSDLRGSPAIDAIGWLVGDGATVSVYDPHAIDGVRAMFGDKINYGADEIDACVGADLLVVLNDFFGGRIRDRLPEAAAVMKPEPTLVDLRNLVTREEAERIGFTYIQV